MEGFKNENQDLDFWFTKMANKKSALSLTIDEKQKLVKEAIEVCRVKGILRKNYSKYHGNMSVQFIEQTFNKFCLFFGTCNIEDPDDSDASMVDADDARLDSKHYIKLFGTYGGIMKKKFMSDTSIEFIPTSDEFSDIVTSIENNPDCFGPRFISDKMNKLYYELPTDFMDMIAPSYHKLSVSLKSLFINVLFQLFPNISYAMLSDHFVMEALYSMLTNGNRTDGGFTFLLLKLIVDDKTLDNDVQFYDFCQEIAEFVTLFEEQKSLSASTLMISLNHIPLENIHEEMMLIHEGSPPCRIKFFRNFTQRLQNLYEEFLSGVDDSIPNIAADVTAAAVPAVPAVPTVPAIPTVPSTPAIAATHESVDNPKDVVPDEGLSLRDTPKTIFHNGMEFSIFDDTDQAVVDKEGPMKYFEYSGNYLVDVVKQGFEGSGVLMDKRSEQMVFHVPCGGKRLPVAQGTQQERRNLENQVLQNYTINSSIYAEFFDSITNEESNVGRFTPHNMELLMKAWDNMITDISSKTSTKITPIALLDLLFLTGPGWLAKNKNQSARYETCRVSNLVGAGCSGSSVQVKPRVQDIMLGDSGKTVVTGNNICNNSQISAADQEIRSQLEGCLAGIEKGSFTSGRNLNANFRNLGLSSSPSKENEILLNFYKFMVQPNNAQEILSLVFDDMQLHQLQVYQQYQVILKNVMLLLCDHCVEHGIVMENGIETSLKTITDKLTVSPIETLNYTCVCVDLYAFCATSVGYSVDIGTISVLTMLQNNNASGHAQVFELVAKLVALKYNGEPISTFCSKVLKMVESINGLAAAKQMNANSSVIGGSAAVKPVLLLPNSTSSSSDVTTGAKFLPDSVVMLLILSMVEEHINRIKSDSSQSINCTIFLDMWSKCSASFKAGKFSRAADLTEEMTKLINLNPLFVPIDSDVGTGGGSVKVLNANIKDPNARVTKFVLKFFKDGPGAPLFSSHIMCSDDNYYLQSTKENGRLSLKFIDHTYFKQMTSEDRSLFRLLKKLSYRFHNISKTDFAKTDTAGKGGKGKGGKDGKGGKGKGKGKGGSKEDSKQDSKKRNNESDSSSDKITEKKLKKNSLQAIVEQLTLLNNRMNQIEGGAKSAAVTGKGSITGGDSAGNEM